MRLPERLRAAWRSPDYRLKLGSCVVVGVLCVVAALLISDPTWRDVAVGFGVTFAAVALIELGWGILDIETVEDRVGSAIVLFEDLRKYRPGLARVWPSRRAWREDDGKQAALAWFGEAKIIDVISNTFHNGWLADADVVEVLRRRLRQGSRVRVVLNHPDGNLLKIRAHDEGETEDKFNHDGMRSEIDGSLRALRRIAHTVAHETGWSDVGLDVRLTYRSMLFHRVLRLDDRMLVDLYLQGASGTSSPSIVVEGEDTALFRTLDGEFAHVYEHAISFDLTQLDDGAPVVAPIPVDSNVPWSWP